MTEYEINHIKKTSTYIHDTDIIKIGTGNLDMLTDSEITEYICDCLTHEHIHMELDKLFNHTVCTLFDGIEYLFRNDGLHNKALIHINRETYQTYINKHGFERFLEYYNLDKHDITDANKLCNTREGTHEWVEIFGVPRHKEIKDIEPDDIIRIYPNHVIIKIEVV